MINRVLLPPFHVVLQQNCRSGNIHLASEHEVTDEDVAKARCKAWVSLAHSGDSSQLLKKRRFKTPATVVRGRTSQSNTMAKVVLRYLGGEAIGTDVHFDVSVACTRTHCAVSYAPPLTI